MKTNAIASTIALCCGLLAGTAGADDDFRCGSRIVKVGMTQAAVLDACGQPASKVVEKVDVRSANQVVGQTDVWRWTYVMNGTTRVLIFDQETLKSIE
jgi:Protein of unknown function (DUF2845)